ncbi:hypothetical protein PUNSTDRAFT_43580 [Punctularia strigosozonata HHB-11173 SS5]|uniref:uncharacterized protein n=1 Tax=Punctularia strigosozonata (strain HHB-11173) TaxID=741275 RepID=UPI00044177C7|nr:uncharacterized protein PUNSTDRAFT_43580 [Punctularia strigosozonata HHB-11173 SS5]EIN10784.1 hypothetical protein PUNSTDRAFT_43580 [Punctularia strigosozonata HHB-11173 SS5]
MGVSIPFSGLSASLSDSDNVNFGDKDSIRRRALMALEGKSDVGTFSKVQIPDFDSPTLVKKPFEFRPGHGFGLNTIAGKRDSFGKSMRSSSALKEQYQLGTLVEEEEDQEQVEDETDFPSSVVDSPASVEVSTPSGAPIRHRPASLNLRPLTLAGGLPTPSLSPNLNSGSRRPMLNIHTDSPSPAKLDDVKSKRLSRISYKPASIDTPPTAAIHGFGLPTPEMTPTSEHRYSANSDVSERPLSTSEQQFLHKSHHALLARIEDLERALSSSRSESRGRSRPASFMSDISSRSHITDSNDEMIQLVTDLKAERDELKLQLEADADGWRSRVAGLENQVGVLAKRVELERREAWVARERAGLLDVEKKALAKDLEVQKAAFHDLSIKHESVRKELEDAKELTESLRGEIISARHMTEECVRLRAALDEERKRREQYERELDHAGLLTTPTPGAFQFPAKPRSSGLSMLPADSDRSLTDVDEPNLQPTAVADPDEDGEDEEHVLAHYEDEDSDLSCGSLHSSVSSFQDHSELSSSGFPKTPSPVSVQPRPSHASRASLSRTWTFPKGPRQTAVKREEEVDTFFGYSEDLDSSPAAVWSGANEELNSGFSFGLNLNEEDELPPFILPLDVGIEVPQPLDIIIDDTDTDNLEGQVLKGGIKFTFTAPTAPSTPEPVERALLVEPKPEFEARVVEAAEVAAAPPPPAAGRTGSAVVRPTTPPRVHAVSGTSKRTAPSFIPQPKGKTVTPIKSAPRRSVAGERKVSPVLFTPPRSPSNSPSDRRTSVFSPQAKAPSSTPPPLSHRALEDTNDPTRYSDSSETPGSAPVLRFPSILHSPVTSVPPQVTKNPATTAPVGPRFSIQTFTSYFPNLSWNPLASGSGTSAQETKVGPAASVPAPNPSTSPGEAVHGFRHLANDPERMPRFVVKAKQLEKLRLRMEEERMRQDAVFMGDCRRCTSQYLSV